MVEFVARRSVATEARDVNWEELGGMVAIGVGFGEDGIDSVSVVPFHGANIGRDGANGDLVGHWGISDRWRFTCGRAGAQ